MKIELNSDVFHNVDILIPYHLKEAECPHCGQDMPDATVSEERVFKTTMNELFTFTNWTDTEKIYNEEVEGFVDDFLFSTVRFFSSYGNKTLVIKPEAVRKIREQVETEIERLRRLDPAYETERGHTNGIE